ncbi:PAS domain-containing sensor histidine kinase [Nocardioides sp. SR21]|uniref:sensor histidine kinase n=1 Tax=Nocardioides sp. SR21 TaxID=2919501 RepID=UPI001FAB0350|nr:PAS domain-containing sensor histidine kinase [Nocardioides sp. SR21]
MTAGEGASLGEALRARVGDAIYQLFDEADEARLLMGTDRGIVLVNQACERMFGYARDRLVGQRARMLTPERLFEDYDRVYVRLVEEGAKRTVNVNLWAVREDGDEFPVRVVCRLLRPFDDHPPLLSLVIADRSDPDDDPLGFFLDTVHSGNVIVDGSGRIVMANARAQELFAYEKDELVGRPVELLVPSAQHARHVSLREGFSGQAQRHEMAQGNRVVGRRRDGSTFPVHVELSTIGTDHDTLISASVRDMSAVEELQSEAERLKSLFLRTVSHELRTPLTSILGSAEMLADEVAAVDDPDLRDRLSWLTGMILRGAQRQHDLVEDLLTLTSVDRGEADRGDCVTDLTVVIENVVHEYRAAAVAVGVDLLAETSDVPILVRADEHWLTRAIDPLVANAVKFTPRGGRAVITAGWTPGEVWLEVADTGPGIPEEEWEQVFDRLHRGAAAVEAEVPGAGLGLAIARSVVHASGGTLAVVPSREGARLRMTLPGMDAEMMR